MSVEQVLSRSGPRRLLALDGGGIRGCISVEVLAKLESLIRHETGKPDLVLGDWFDYVGGTSTGAILATCIASGMAVARIREFYQEQGAAMFQQASLLKRLWFTYEREPLAAKLREVLGADARLGSPDLRCLLLLVLRNASTDSPWPLSNNPRARYNDRRRPDCNLDLPLWQLVRASAAAPTFFPPEYVRLESKEFVFVDGGVTSYNNPSFLLFLMATLEPYRLQWPTGPEKMLLVSIGTGTSPTTISGPRGSSPNLLENARGIPLALMSSASAQQDFLCRAFGRCRSGIRLDREVGDLVELESTDAPGNLTGLPKLFTYLRYDVELTNEGLEAIGVDGIDPKSIESLDDVSRIPELQRVGLALAGSVEAAHLAGFA